MGKITSLKDIGRIKSTTWQQEKRACSHSRRALQCYGIDMWTLRVSFYTLSRYRQRPIINGKVIFFP